MNRTDRTLLVVTGLIVLAIFVESFRQNSAPKASHQRTLAELGERLIGRTEAEVQAELGEPFMRLGYQGGLPAPQAAVQAELGEPDTPFTLDKGRRAWAYEPRPFRDEQPFIIYFENGKVSKIMSWAQEVR